SSARSSSLTASDDAAYDPHRDGNAMPVPHCGRTVSARQRPGPRPCPADRPLHTGPPPPPDPRDPNPPGPDPPPGSRGSTGGRQEEERDPPVGPRPGFHSEERPDGPP